MFPKPQFICSAKAGWLPCIVLSFLVAFGVARAANPPKPPAPQVRLAPAADYQWVPYEFLGLGFDPKTQRIWNMHHRGQAAIYGRSGEALRLVVSAQNESAASFQVAGSVADYYGRPVHKFQFELAVPAKGKTQQVIAFTPTEQQNGPFYISATWEQVNGRHEGALSLVAGQANTRFTVQDFEVVRHPKPGGTFETTTTARKRGDYGLLVRLPPLEKPPTDPNRRRHWRPKPSTLDVPLYLALPGRPVKVGVWLKTNEDLKLEAKFSDPGFDARQSTHYDTWNVGPIDIKKGEWQYLQIPIPGFSRPKAQRRKAGEANGIMDYPLTLQYLRLTAKTPAQVSLDSIEAWTQGEVGDSLRVRLANSKPLGLFYRNDVLRLRLANGWLWGKPVPVRGQAALLDWAKRRTDLGTFRADLAPGAEQLALLKLKDLRLGPHKLEIKADAGTRRVQGPDTSYPHMVYEPKAKALGYDALIDIVGSRDAVLFDLGLLQDQVMIPWHSVDGSPSVEPYPAQWSFDWLTPAIAGRRKAGLEVAGVLGFTPLWADPSASFNRRMGAWYGSTYTMPARKIYWEEYVLRTAETYKDMINTWIVWDRPDSSAFKASAKDYVENLVKVAHKAAREANPNARIITGGVTRENIEKFLIALADAGAHRSLHGIGLYPTTAPLSPEDGYMEVLLERAQRIRREEKIEAPLWILNLDWATGAGQYRVDEYDQSRYVVRSYVIARACGIDHILLRADGTTMYSRRDSANLIYEQGGLTGIKPAALAAKTVISQLHGSVFRQDLFLQDRWAGLSRGYLFTHPQGHPLLVLWRCSGTSRLQLPTAPAAIVDVYGNPVAAGRQGTATVVDLQPDPIFVHFPKGAWQAVAKNIERTPLRFEDAPESAWKGKFRFHLDVGNADDEARVKYRADNARIVGPIDSHYHNDYGRRIIDRGRHFLGAEAFEIDVKGYGKADLLIRKRINYASPDQMVQVFCNGRAAGQWFAFKRDRRYRWRDVDFVVPNRFFAGETRARMKFVCVGGREATSYYYWAAPLQTRTIYLSDMPLLVNTSGYGPGANRDRNILGGEMRFYKLPDKTFTKGIGTNGAATMAKSLIVIPLNKSFKRFRATVGIDTATNGKGSVRFRIGDGTKMLWDSKDMTYYSAPKDIDIDVSNSIILMLWTGDSGDGHRNDIANWANARLELK